jgi:hypothetical protein
MLQIVKVKFESLSSVTVNHHYYTELGVKASESLANTYTHLGHHNCSFINASLVTSQHVGALETELDCACLYCSLYNNSTTAICLCSKQILQENWLQLVLPCVGVISYFIGCDVSLPHSLQAFVFSSKPLVIIYKNFVILLINSFLNF